MAFVCVHVIQVDELCNYVEIEKHCWYISLLNYTDSSYSFSKCTEIKQKLLKTKPKTQCVTKKITKCINPYILKVL